MVFSIFFFKQKTAYEMRISDWSSDVCSSDLPKMERGISAPPGDRPLRNLDRLQLHPLRDLHIGSKQTSDRNDLAAVERMAAKMPGIEIGRRRTNCQTQRYEHEGQRRSEERSVGKESVSTCRSRWSTYH